MENTELIRFTTAGSVDDGKSTLIGRLLFDTKLIMEDQLEALQRSSDITGEGQINLANLTDGLRAEREQGITIDVAYRYFATPRRKFIVADTPGHVQYTRNMVTGASTANLAIILVDARQGVIQQTRRHAYVASLLRIPHVVICINKMDLVAYSQEIFDQIREDFSNFAAGLAIRDVTFIPISALNGDNIVDKSTAMEWYFGSPLLRHLEDVYIGNDRNLQDARFPVQFVIRPYSDAHHDFRGFAGQIAGGFFRVGDEVTVLPSGKKSVITQIHTHDGDLQEAFAPMSVTLLLADDIDISRGDMIVKRDNIPVVAQEFEAMICWMVDDPLRRGAKYGIKLGTKSARCMPMEIQYRVNIDTLAPETSATALCLNEIGRVKFKATTPLVFDPYSRNRYTGGFILIDEATNITVGAGMICEPRRIVPGSDEDLEFVI